MSFPLPGFCFPCDLTSTSFPVLQYIPGTVAFLLLFKHTHLIPNGGLYNDLLPLHRVWSFCSPSGYSGLNFGIKTFGFGASLFRQVISKNFTQDGFHVPYTHTLILFVAFMVILIPVHL